MNTEKYSDFLFDLDGTLIDSFEDIKSCLEHSYNHILNERILIDRTIIGPPLYEMIEKISPGLTPEIKDLIVKEFRKVYDSSIYPLTFDVKGATELLRQLKTTNKRIYLVTNKAYKPTLRILSKFQIDFFIDVLSPDKFTEKRFSKGELIGMLLQWHHLDKSRTVMIGDSVQDILAAKENGIDSISILDGYESADSLKEARPTFMVKNINELLQSF